MLYFFIAAATPWRTKHRSTAAAAESCVDVQSMDGLSDDGVELVVVVDVNVSEFPRSALNLRPAGVKASSGWTWRAKRHGLALAKADLRCHQLVARTVIDDLWHLHTHLS